MNRRRISKALGAARGGFVAGVGTYLAAAGHLDVKTVAEAVAAGVAAAVVAGVGAYFAPANTPAK